jgi:hypothetical protein
MRWADVDVLVLDVAEPEVVIDLAWLCVKCGSFRPVLRGDPAMSTAVTVLGGVSSALVLVLPTPTFASMGRCRSLLLPAFFSLSSVSSSSLRMLARPVSLSFDLNFMSRTHM